MRDPARIDRIIGLVRQYWHEHPDLRLGQLIGNMATLQSSYNMEDTELEVELRKALGKEKKG